MLRLRIFIIGLFILSVFVAFSSGPIEIEFGMYINALLIYLLFTFLYSHLNTTFKKGNLNLEYSISYGLSIAMFTGPLGVFIYEFISRFYTYFERKYSDTADEDEFLHTFYNIGAFALNHAIGFYLFHYFSGLMGDSSFAYWLIVVLIVILLNFLSDIYLSVVFYSIGDIKSFKDVIDFMKTRSFNDTLKKAVSNGLLYVFLLEQQWNLLLALFVLNYLVSRSLIVKSQSAKHKLERDRYEQMAYTDFLSKVHNRAYMNKIMNEYNHSGENIAIVVGDIDSFKSINDTYNHTVGDSVIQHFAATLKSNLQENDYIFRSGGEEFTLILTERTFRECMDLVESLKDIVKNSEVEAEYQTKNVKLPYTASFGVYYYKATEDFHIKNAYSMADDLLLKAKKLGKNRVNGKNGLIGLPLSARYNMK
ncbi:GGDEF domain-containing protein [Oceanobacillus piezotolerans]|uniref:GGDEF domain-containing protein n=1 Tax=Oceanobacillus piezotolerans TaxID=2448030 RepID=A0A498D8C7_9BACI|nr:GGDEF domain-containing protein [Oceanobacillus piezotolerans]RLL42783.1 GGDEF domain-containing protein [Oceanobacillus piezotolerans]